MRRIPNPMSGFDFGLLPRAGDLFTVASLASSANAYSYTVYRFDSEVGSWTSKKVSLEAPRKPYPVKVPMNALRLNHHLTSTVITLGGEAGTMGWVDLWTGILLYDLFPQDEERPPVLRHVPLPMPMHAISQATSRLTELACCPLPFRGIASVVKHGKPCLRLADLQIMEDFLHHYDIELELPCYRVHNWAITTWNNTKMGHSDSFDDWQEDLTVWASEITISDTVRSELLASGLLRREPSEDGEEAVELALQNLTVSEPAPSLNGDEDVVYLMARPKRFYPKAWALAVDMKNRTLLGVVEFGSVATPTFAGVTYCSSAISNYMDSPTLQ